MYYGREKCLQDLQKPDPTSEALGNDLHEEELAFETIEDFFETTLVYAPRVYLSHLDPERFTPKSRLNKFGLSKFNKSRPKLKSPLPAPSSPLKLFTTGTRDDYPESKYEERITWIE